MKRLLIFLLVSIVFITACAIEREGEEILSKQEENYVLKGGYSFGECNKNCKGTLVIINNKLTYTSFKNGENTPLKECSENIAASVVAGLTGGFNFDAFLNLPAIIGCPDCADGGAEWIELSKGGKAHKVTFEYGKPPVQLGNISLFFHSQFTRFENCR